LRRGGSATASASTSTWQGRCAFVRSSSGHILGIVNPPVKPAKRQYWVAPARRSDTADGWRTKAVENAGSWWEDWMAWLKPQAGELVDAAPVAGKAYPALADAPGTYVLEH
jgi:polyhydroxyalkanoate synthase